LNVYIVLLYNRFTRTSKYSLGLELKFCSMEQHIKRRGYKHCIRNNKHMQQLGKLFGDKGYLSQSLAQSLRELFDLQLITKLRSNMKNQLMLWTDRMLLCRRAIVETIINQLKNISQIEHSRHRSVANFFVNVLCGLIAYCRRPTKPSLGLDQLLPLPA
jgi:Transposase DDE domain